MAAEITREDQAALDLHKIMLEAMRAREGEILRFAAFLLPALGGVFAFPWLAQAQGKTLPCNTLLITTLAVIILLFFGGWYTLALSYNYRYLNVVVRRLQNHLRLARFQPKKWTQSWGEREQSSRLGCALSLLNRFLLFDFAPEIFRTLVLLFFVLMLFVLTVSIPLRSGLKHSSYVITLNLVALVGLQLIGSCFYWRKLEKLEKDWKEVRGQTAAEPKPVSTPAG